MKKYLMLALTAVILLTAVSGSIAFFTDSISTTNVIASGNLDIQQHEYERKKNADGTYTLQTYTQKQMVYPVVKSSTERVGVTVNGAEVQMYGAGMRNFVDKIVTVNNVGSLPVYVRTYVAVPTKGGSEWIHLDQNKSTDGWDWSAASINNVEIGGETYNIHFATYTKPLMAGETTPPSLLGFYLNSQFTNKGGSYYFKDVNLGADPELTILVASEATQAIGYKGDEDPLNKVFTDANHALNTVFALEDAEQHHPWDGTVIVNTQEALTAALTDAPYDTRIALRNGQYELPESLPAGVHLSGWGMDVVVTAKGGKLSASNAELQNVTFGNAVSFSGSAGFHSVVFANKLTAALSAPTLFSACNLAKGCEITNGKEFASFDEQCVLPAGFTLDL